MSRMEEIRARWNETDKYTPSGYNDTLYRHAPADLAFLIASLECAEAHIENWRERAETAEAERDDWHRIADQRSAEIIRLTEALAAQREEDAALARTLCDKNCDPHLGDHIAAAIRSGGS